MGYKILVLLACAGLLLPNVGTSERPEGAVSLAIEDEIKIEVLKTKANDLVLSETILIKAPRAKVWQAYVTEKGYAAWAAPVVKVDLKIGGTIKTHYSPNAKIGDRGTNTLHIINYVPERLLTIQADVGPNWPEIMKQDAKRLMNVITFEDTAEGHTVVRSYGIGYRNTPELMKLLNTFKRWNRGLYVKLKKTLESSEPK